MTKSKSRTPGSAPASVREIVDKFTARVRHNIDVHLETLATEIYEALEDPEGTGKVDAKRAVAQIARASARVDAAEARTEVFTRLVTAIRMIDEAATLRGILEGLGRGAAMEAARVAVMLIDGDVLRPFADFGFASGARPADLRLDEAPLVARAIHERLRISLASARSSELPPFMRQAPGAAGLATPVIVGGDVVALLYAEGPARAAEGTAGPVWMEHVEVLSRHAAARLEAVTSRRTVEVMNTSA